MFNKGSKRKANQEKKDKYVSKSLTRIIISLFVAVIAWVGATAFEAYLLADKNVSTVVVASKDVPAGLLIDESNSGNYFTMKSVNSNLVTGSTITDLSQVGGKTLTEITTGEIVSTNRFYHTDYANEGISDPVEITFTAAAADRAICGGIRKGDLIDIIGIHEDETGAIVSEVIRDNAYVLEAYDSSGYMIQDEDTTSQAVSFKIYVERAEEAMYNENFSISSITVVKVTGK